MAGTTSKSISLTDKATGTAFKLQASAIIFFYAVNSGADSLVRYVDPATDQVIDRTVDEVVATINTAAAKTFLVTTTDGTVVYIHSDRIIFIADLTTYRQISYYDESLSVLKQLNVTNSAASINTAAGTTFAVTMTDNTTRYINNNLVRDISTNSAVKQAILAVLLRAESAAIVTAGTGYLTGDTISITGGTGTPAVLTIASTKLVAISFNLNGTGYSIGDTITLAGGTHSIAAVLTVTAVDGGGAVLGYTITTPGSYTVEAVSLTQASTSGSGTGASFTLAHYGVLTTTISTVGSYSATPANPVSGTTTGLGTGATFTVLYELASITVVDPGLGYSQAPTIVIAGDGTLGAATATIVNGQVNHVTVTVPGGSYTNATATATSGAGSVIMYDSKLTANEPLHVTQTQAALQTAINAL